MQVSQLHQYVLFLENILTQEEYNSAYGLFTSTEFVPSGNGEGIDQDNTNYLHNSGPPLEDIANNIINKIIPIASTWATEPVLSFRPSIRKWHPGEYQTPHCDNYTPEGYLVVYDPLVVDSPYPFFLVDYSFIYYLNDDYEGGELYFTEMPELKIPKRKNSGVLLLSNKHHGVTKLLSNNRYTVVALLTKARTLASNLLPKVSHQWKEFIVNPQDIYTIIDPSDLKLIEHQSTNIKKEGS